jgi:hypothetical protein
VGMASRWTARPKQHHALDGGPDGSRHHRQSGFGSVIYDARTSGSSSSRGSSAHSFGFLAYARTCERALQVACQDVLEALRDRQAGAMMGSPRCLEALYKVPRRREPCDTARNGLDCRALGLSLARPGAHDRMSESIAGLSLRAGSGTGCVEYNAEPTAARQARLGKSSPSSTI